MFTAEEVEAAADSKAIQRLMRKQRQYAMQCKVFPRAAELQPGQMLLQKEGGQERAGGKARNFSFPYLDYLKM
jgi:hypothetical protein